MKRGTFSLIALLGGALLAPGYADKVRLEQLPADLQAKIRAQTAGARVEDIDRDVRNGKTTYEVAFKNAQGQNTELVFEDTGSLAGSANSTTLDSRKMTYAELPAPVRRAADAQVQGGEVNDVERKLRNGRVTYGIGFKGPNGTGPQREIVLDSQGNLLRGRGSVNRSSASASASTTSPATSTSVSTSTIAYGELPQDIRKVAEAHLNNGAVERVERQSQNGQVNYFINFKNDSGSYQQMLIAQDGRILSNQLVSASAAGSAPAAQSGAATQPSNPSAVTTLAPLSNSSVLDLSQVPPEVRRAIRTQLGNAKVEEVLRGNWSGRPVYQVAFTDQNQKYVEMQFEQNGQVLYDPRGTSTTSTAPSTSGNLLQNIGRALLNTPQQ